VGGICRRLAAPGPAVSAHFLFFAFMKPQPFSPDVPSVLNIPVGNVRVARPFSQPWSFGAMRPCFVGRAGAFFRFLFDPVGAVSSFPLTEGQPEAMIIRYST